ncbi:RNA polymerase sigma factor [Rhodophyticola porphyridii]|uniref:RNA polymerase sigma factor n=1 Tax=Rhodophyticola porphyridii TaxID=1852017 RepID=UPI0035D0C6F7
MGRAQPCSVQRRCRSSPRHHARRMSDAVRAVERVARLSYGKLVARLAARIGSLAEAEDALGDALTKALETWPDTGVPDSPEAWLTTTARRRAIDHARTGALPTIYEQELTRMAEERAEMIPPATDPRLPLMFICAHPAIDEALRAPLMLQTVLGLDARRMASVFLMSPGTLGQRLTRVKSKIESARITFDLPEGRDFADRMADVLNAIYGAYVVGYNGIPAGDRKAASLAEEAIWLASLVAHGFPDEGEAHGLFALMLFAEARRPARIDPANGALVPLEEQNTDLWDRALLIDAEKALRNATRNPSLGRFQLEASIQAVHAARRRSRATDWSELRLLYAGLVGLSPTVGARTGEAAVLIEKDGPTAALAALEAIPEVARRSYQPWWAARAHALARLGRIGEAREAFDRAIGLSDDPAARTYLAGCKARLLQS